jgi:hypothetical protein
MARDTEPKNPSGSGPEEGTDTPDTATTRIPLMPLTEADRERWLNEMREEYGDEWIEANRGLLESQWEELKNF